MSERKAAGSPTVEVRVEREERDLWLRVAELRGQTISELVRLAVRAHIGEPVPDVGPLDPTVFSATAAGLGPAEGFAVEPGDLEHGAPSPGDSGGPTPGAECASCGHHAVLHRPGRCGLEECACTGYVRAEDLTTVMDLPTPAPAGGEFPDLEPWRPTTAPPYDHERPRPVSVEAGRERFHRASDHPVEPEVDATGGLRYERVEPEPARRPVELRDVVEAVDHLRVVLGEWLDLIEGDTP